MKQTKTKPVEFSCHAPAAKAVFVAGTFNDWKPDASPLHNHQPASGSARCDFRPDTMNSSSSWMASGAASRAASTNIVAGPNAGRTNSAR